MKEEAVLFDYDGVIGDTMSDNARAWRRAFSDFGVHITDLDYYELEGLSPAAVARELGTKNGLSEDVISQIPPRKAEYYRSDNTFRIYPEIPELVNKLKADGKKLALVSGAARHRIEEMTPRPLLDDFDVVIAAEDVTRPKPDPEPYMKAMEKLGVLPSQAIIIENAPLGIQSAKAAGCFTVAIETTLPKERLIGADVIINSHRDLRLFL